MPSLWGRDIYPCVHVYLTVFHRRGRGHYVHRHRRRVLQTATCLKSPQERQGRNHGGLRTGTGVEGKREEVKAVLSSAGKAAVSWFSRRGAARAGRPHGGLRADPGMSQLLSRMASTHRREP